MDQTTYLIENSAQKPVSAGLWCNCQAGESVGINFAFDRINRTPNSIDSHRFIRFAKQNGAHETVVETLFFEYFINGKDIGRKDVLCDIGTQIGLQSNIIEAYLNSDKDINFVHDENVRAHRMGVNGVPAFIFNEKILCLEPQVYTYDRCCIYHRPLAFAGSFVYLPSHVLWIFQICSHPPACSGDAKMIKIGKTSKIELSKNRSSSLQ